MIKTGSGFVCNGVDLILPLNTNRLIRSEIPTLPGTAIHAVHYNHTLKDWPCKNDGTPMRFQEQQDLYESKSVKMKFVCAAILQAMKAGKTVQ